MKVNFKKAFSTSEKVELYVLAGQVGSGTYKTIIGDVELDSMEIETPVTGGTLFP